MFSSISSYIWGGENEAASSEEASPNVLSTPPTPRSPSPSGDDWVMVGPTPAPGDLTGALTPLPVTPASLSGTSTPASLDEGEAEEIGSTAQPPIVINRGRPNDPAARVQALVSEEVKQERQSQIQKQKNTGKALSSKALKRSNKTIMAEQGKKTAAFRQNFNIKMAGNNKNLKQC